MGFKDGTNNIHAEDRAAVERYVWAAGSDQPAWMRGGSYLIVRRSGCSSTLGRDEASG